MVVYLNDVVFFCHRFKDAWEYCLQINDKDAWLTLGKAALHNIEIEFGKSHLGSLFVTA